MDKGLLPTLVVGFDILSVLMWFALGITAAIAIAYFVYLFTYYKKHLEKGTGISVQTKAKKAAIILGICFAVIIAGAIACPILQGVFQAKIV